MPSWITAVSIVVLCAAQATAQTSVNWVNSASGNWSDHTQWSTGTVPNNNGGTTYAAAIDQSDASYIIELDSSIALDSLSITSSNATVRQTSGTLSASVVDVNKGFFRLQGGTIANSEIRSLQSSGRMVVMGGNDTTSFFDNVSIIRTVAVGSTRSTGGSTSAGNLRISNDLQLLGTSGGLWFQGGAGTVILSGDQTISGVPASGNQRSEIVFGQENNYQGTLAAENGTLTIGPNVQIRVASGRFNTVGHEDEGLILKGRVLSTQSTRSINITGDNWINEGLLQQGNGGQINLRGTFATGNLGDWSSDNNDVNGRIAILGTLDNTGAILDFTKDADTGIGGSMRLQNGGVIVGGTIKAPSSSTPFRTNPGNTGSALLDGVTIDGFMTMQPGEVRVANNLTLINDTVVTAQGSSKLTFSGDQSIVGSGQIMFDQAVSVVTADVGGSLTIADGITIGTRLGNGIVGQAGANLINDGSLTARLSTRTLEVFGDSILNNGTISTTSSGTIRITSDDISNTGLIDIYSGSLIVSSAIQNSGTITGHGNITGGVINTGSINPGSSPGILTIDSLTQTAGGSLNFEIGGLDRGFQNDNHDAFVLDSLNLLDGTIVVSLINGYTPMSGDSFDLLDWNSASFGSYSFDFSNAQLGPALGWDTSEFESTGSLLVTAVPEPANGLVITLFGLGLTFRRKQRSK